MVDDQPFQGFDLTYPRKENALNKFRVQLDYYDNNESFAQHLPVLGSVREQCVSDNGTSGWYLVNLDLPINFQHCDPDGRSHGLLSVSRVLIRSRWLDEPIEAGREPSVFLLLVRENQSVNCNSIHVEDYIHICWARCRILADE